MFNKTYQSRANRRGDLQSVREILNELVRKADADPRFYRPRYKPDPVGRAGKRSGVSNPGQLSLEFADRTNDPVPATQSLNDNMRDPQRPLFDLFPEAYQ